MAIKFVFNPFTGTLDMIDESLSGTIGSFTDGSVVFAESGTLAEDNANLFWDNGNNRLGIGTNSPSQALELIGTLRLASLGSGILHSDINGDITSSAVDLTSDVTGTLPIGNGGTGATSFTAGSVVFSNGSILTQDNSNFFWDDANNRLGIGIDGSDNTISINGLSFNQQIVSHSNASILDIDLSLNRYNDTAVVAPVLVTNRSRGTHATKTAVQNGDTLSRWSFTGYDGTNFEIGAAIDVIVDGVPGNNDMPGRFVFSTTPDGSITPVEAMRLTSDQKAIFSGAFQISTLGTGIGHLDASGNLTSSAVNLASADVTGTLAMGNGGTGSTSFTSGSIPFSNGSILTQNNSNLLWDNSNIGLKVAATDALSATRRIVAGALVDNEFRFGSALLGFSNFGGFGLASFCHINHNTVFNSAFAQDSALGATYINCPSGSNINISVGAVGIMQLNFGACILLAGTNLRFVGSTSGYTQFRAAATSASNTLFWPGSAPSASDVLSSDGSGNMSWTKVADANVSSSAAIAVSKLAALTATRIVSTNGSGVLQTNAALTANKIPYATSAGNLATPTNLHWDNTNTSLGIGNASPQGVLHLTHRSADMIHVGNTVDTTDATTATAVSFSTTTNTSYLVEAKVVGRRTGGTAGAAGDYAIYIIRCGANNVSGTLTIDNKVISYSFEDQPSWVADLSVSGTNLLVRVTGAANNNITWDGFLTIMRT